ncbi:hypothetical protein DL96DRAFT_1457618 [Flagelloscypha sp. PMI_526]|nr:hypothetical protein DL96DRAFT_1457618 [Flagelloscypha sp. PMI_526]
MWNFLISSDASVQSTHVMGNEVAILQRDLSKKAAQRFAENDFESEWKACSASKREEWILEGLVRTCSASPDFEERRRSCPEITLARLNKNNGQGLLDLLKGLVLDDISKVPTQCKQFKCDAFDRMFGFEKNIQHPGRQLLQLGAATKRTYFLVMFLWNVLLAFYGEWETYGLSKSSEVHSKREIRNRAKDLKTMGLSSEDYYDVLDIASKKRQEAVRSCANCKLPPQMAGVTDLVACARCKKIGRLVYYCGKPCQVNEWKNGNPPHKKICGDKTALLNATLSSPSTSTSVDASSDPDEDEDEYGWPKPKPGYTRSPALQYQLKFLSEKKGVNYVFIQPAPHNDYGITIPDIIRRAMFEVCMRRAVASHSPREVLMMFGQLEPFAESIPSFGVLKLKAQLKKEFGVDVDEVQAALDAHDAEIRDLP